MVLLSRSPCCVLPAGRLPQMPGLGAVFPLLCQVPRGLTIVAGGHGSHKRQRLTSNFLQTLCVLRANSYNQHASCWLCKAFREELTRAKCTFPNPHPGSSPFRYKHRGVCQGWKNKQGSQVWRLKDEGQLRSRCVSSSTSCPAPPPAPLQGSSQSRRALWIPGNAPWCALVQLAPKHRRGPGAAGFLQLSDNRRGECERTIIPRPQITPNLPTVREQPE